MAAPKDNAFFVALEVARAIDAERKELQQGLEAERESIPQKVIQMGKELDEMRDKLLLIKEEINEALLLVNKDVNAFKPSEETLDNNLNINNKLELPVSTSFSSQGGI